MCNFLKNYGGGIGALQSKMGVSPEIAEALNRGYYEAFPKILDYQKWVESEIATYGYVTNLFGRRYYIKYNNNAYKAYNYLIQGGCADFVKDKEIQVYELLKKYKSKLLLPIHDELVIRIDDDEPWLIDKIKEVMDDCRYFISTVPMYCEPEYTTTNWAEKVDY
jgi:DNA polymerase-1